RSPSSVLTEFWKATKPPRSQELLGSVSSVVGRCSKRWLRGEENGKIVTAQPRCFRMIAWKQDPVQPRSRCHRYVGHSTLRPETRRVSQRGQQNPCRPPSPCPLALGSGEGRVRMPCPDAPSARPNCGLRLTPQTKQLCETTIRLWGRFPTCLGKGGQAGNVPPRKAVGEAVPPSNPHRPDSARALGLRARIVVLG